MPLLYASHFDKHFLILPLLWSDNTVRWDYEPYFKDEENETWSSKVTCPGSHLVSDRIWIWTQAYQAPKAVPWITANQHHCSLLSTSLGHVCLFICVFLVFLSSVSPQEWRWHQQWKEGYLVRYTCAFLFRLLYVHISSDPGVQCSVIFIRLGSSIQTGSWFFFHLIVFNELVFPQHLDSVHVWFFQSKEREKVLVFWGVNDMLFTIDDGAADTRLSYCNLDGCILYMQTLRKVINLQKKILSSRTFSSVFRVVIFS